MIGDIPKLSADQMASLRQLAKEIRANCEAQAGLEGFTGDPLTVEAMRDAFAVMATEAAHARSVAAMIAQTPGMGDLVISIAVSNFRHAIAAALAEVILEKLSGKAAGR